MNENENENDINAYEPSLLHPRQIKKNIPSLTQKSTFSRCNLSLKRKRNRRTLNPNIHPHNKENVHPGGQCISKNNEGNSRQILGLVDYANKNNLERESTDFNFSLSTYKNCFVNRITNDSKQILSLCHAHNFGNTVEKCINKNINTNISLFSVNLQSYETLSAYDYKENSQKNVPFSQISIDSSILCNSCENINEYNNTKFGRPEISLLFSVQTCKNVEISTGTCDIKNIRLDQNVNDLQIYCKLLENVELSSCQSSTCQEGVDSENDDLETCITLTMYVNIEIKKEKLQAKTEKEKKSQVNKVLILNTNAIRNISTVIVQPPNYKLVKRQISDKSKLKRRRTTVSGILKKNERVSSRSDKWKQKSILDYLNKQSHFVDVSSQSDQTLLLENCIVQQSTCKNGKSLLNQGTSVEGYGYEMSKNLGLIESNQPDFKIGKSKSRNNEQLPKSKSPTFRSEKSPKKQNLKISSTVTPRSPPHKSSFETVPNYSSSPMRSIGSPELCAIKSKSKKSKDSISIPYYKIIAGTHFAVDAFCYGKIPHVENYFLTHFHSDHYTGLNKSFSKTIFCSKITAELCVTRLGVNYKCVSIINPDETILIDGVEITAVDANHCPGAIMLIFTLLNGKTILHTGDFRATPAMESYPIFWNKDIHTVYLDTTYCNPRYDFPTQDQSLEMALYLLRQKKQEVEKAGHSFSSVLIVCGTYTIGKEKFLLGIARRVGCSVWASSEKATVLSAVEGHVFNMPPPQTCQLHALPMRDLTYEKLKSYLDSFKGTFNEVVAFKPSGWENGKNSTIEKDKVTIHGIPYSEHSSFSEMVRFIKYLKPKLVVPTVDISGGVKSVQKYFPCPLVYKEDDTHQTRVTDYFSMQRQQVPAVT